MKLKQMLNEVELGQKVKPEDLSKEAEKFRYMISVLASDKARKFIQGEEIREFVSPELFEMYKKLNMLINNPTKFK